MKKFIEQEGFKFAYTDVRNRIDQVEKAKVNKVDMGISLNVNTPILLKDDNDELQKDQKITFKVSAPSTDTINWVSNKPGIIIPVNTREFSINSHEKGIKRSNVKSFISFFTSNSMTVGTSRILEDITTPYMMINSKNGMENEKSTKPVIETSFNQDTGEIYIKFESLKDPIPTMTPENLQKLRKNSEVPALGKRGYLTDDEIKVTSEIKGNFLGWFPVQDVGKEKVITDNLLGPREDQYISSTYISFKFKSSDLSKINKLYMFDYGNQHLQSVDLTKKKDRISYISRYTYMSAERQLITGDITSEDEYVLPDEAMVKDFIANYMTSYFLVPSLSADPVSGSWIKLSDPIAISIDKNRVVWDALGLRTTEEIFNFLDDTEYTAKDIELIRETLIENKNLRGEPLKISISNQDNLTDTKIISVVDHNFLNKNRKNLSFNTGTDTEVRGVGSHAEGIATKAIGDYSHAEGNNSIALGQSSHSEGLSEANISEIISAANNNPDKESLISELKLELDEVGNIKDTVNNIKLICSWEANPLNINKGVNIIQGLQLNPDEKIYSLTPIKRIDPNTGEVRNNYIVASIRRSKNMSTNSPYEGTTSLKARLMYYDYNKDFSTGVWQNINIPAEIFNGSTNSDEVALIVSDTVPERPNEVGLWVLPVIIYNQKLKFLLDKKSASGDSNIYYWYTDNILGSPQYGQINKIPTKNIDPSFDLKSDNTKYFPFCAPTQVKDSEGHIMSYFAVYWESDGTRVPIFLYKSGASTTIPISKHEPSDSILNGFVTGLDMVPCMNQKGFLGASGLSKIPFINNKFILLGALGELLVGGWDSQTNTCKWSVNQKYLDQLSGSNFISTTAGINIHPDISFLKKNVMNKSNIVKPETGFWEIWKFTGSEIAAAEIGEKILYVLVDYREHTITEEKGGGGGSRGSSHDESSIWYFVANKNSTALDLLNSKWSLAREAVDKNGKVNPINYEVATNKLPDGSEEQSFPAISGITYNGNEVVVAKNDITQKAAVSSTSYAYTFVTNPKLIIFKLNSDGSNTEIREATFNLNGITASTNMEGTTLSVTCGPLILNILLNNTPPVPSVIPEDYIMVYNDSSVVADMTGAPIKNKNTEILLYKESSLLKKDITPNASFAKVLSSIGDNSHAEGWNTKAIGDYSHVEGVNSVAAGVGSHAEGLGTTAVKDYQHVFGSYNISNDSCVEIVGNGTKELKKNIRVLDKDGNETLAGTLTQFGNDIVDAIEVPEEVKLEAGYCYCFDGKNYYKSTKNKKDQLLGIHSDTYGSKVCTNIDLNLETTKNSLNIAVAGFVLAHVDKEYPAGTLLTCTKNGYLTKASITDKIFRPERIIGTFYKNEPEKTWLPASKNIKVNNRSWIKVK